MIDKLQRARMFAMFADCPIVYLENPFNNGDMWFLAYSFNWYDPSSHKYVNELVKCKNITHEVNNTMELSQDSFLTNIDQLPILNVIFCNNVKWLRVK